MFHEYLDHFAKGSRHTPEECDSYCSQWPEGLRSFSAGKICSCNYDDGYAPGGPKSKVPCPVEVGVECFHMMQGSGEIVSANNMNHESDDYYCYAYNAFPVIPVTEATTEATVTESTSEGTGDPHFRTWKDEHFEFHGQCDLVMTKVKNFVQEEGPDLEIQLRTQIVRYWSYIKSAAIRIGNDILEVKGSPERYVLNYWNNFEHNGELTNLGGFPVSINNNKEIFTIDLDSVYPGQKIEIKTFKEFVGVKIIGANEESFGNAIGITGDFKTGKTLARDGHTVLNDFNELGLEWQVLPSDGKLFHEMARPQFPELCYLPEDPRGERTRRLAESDITEEAAEAACAGLKDEFDRKGCIYDILATQDMDMVGAY